MEHLGTIRETVSLEQFDRLRRANITRAKEWDAGGQCGALFYSNAVGGECGEMQNVVKKLERARLGLKGKRATMADLADEMADMIIYADLLAHVTKIDLWPAIVKKFNEVSEREGFQTRI